jgi:uncharacterized protein
MKIFITGGSGFVGRHLSSLFLNKGHQVTATGTRSTQNHIVDEKFHYISADTTRTGDWQNSVKDADAVINLAGHSIFSLWTRSYKKQIYDSRILTTRNLVEALPENKNIIFCSTSAAGYYGDRSDDLLTENEPPGNDFLARVCRDWESEAFRAEEKGVRVITMRFGVVFGKNGGAIGKMITPFRFFLGGPLGSGQQWFPWIHISDLLSAILFVIENESIKGPLNFTASEPVRQKEFAKTLGKVLNRPAIMPAPAFIVRLIMGELGASLLASQRVIPRKLSEYGFKFRYPDIRSALRDIVS